MSAYEKWVKGLGLPEAKSPAPVEKPVEAPPVQCPHCRKQQITAPEFRSVSMDAFAKAAKGSSIRITCEKCQKSFTEVK